MLVSRHAPVTTSTAEYWMDSNCFGKVHSLSSGKVEMYLCAACHAFTLHVDARKIEEALWFRFRLGGTVSQLDKCLKFTAFRVREGYFV